MPVNDSLAVLVDNSVTLAKLDHGTQGDIYYCDTGGAPSRLATGTAGQLLTSGGSGANPSWTAPVPAGTILAFGGTSAPTGFLNCDGSNVSRTTYAALFTAISTTWGVGNGSTTFGIPDLRRRTPVGSGGTGTATLGNAVGNTGGEATHQLSVAELAAHTHSYGILAGAYYSPSGSYYPIAYSGGNTTGSAGSDTAHNIIQPSAVVYYIIKT